MLDFPGWLLLSEGFSLLGLVLEHVDFVLQFVTGPAVVLLGWVFAARYLRIR